MLLPRALFIVSALLPLACSGTSSDPVAPSPADAGSDVATAPDDTQTPDVVDTSSPLDTAETDSALAPDEGEPPDVGPSAPTPVWTALKDAPQVLWGAMMASAGTAGVFEGFGGSGYPASGVSALTWAYATKTDDWGSEALASAPPKRYCHCLVALPERGELLLVGGRNDAGGLKAAAWIYDTAKATWTPIAAPVPGGTIGCHAGWLPALNGGSAVVFGGQGLTVGMDDTTWIYDPEAAAFSVLDTKTSPPARRDAATASDVAGGRILVFGGQTAPLPAAEHANDLWQFDGNDWAPVVATGTPPSPRRYPAAAFDEARREWVLFSGTDETQDFEDFFLYDAVTDAWSSLPTAGAPPFRSFGTFFYDPLTDAYFLFGGLNALAMAGVSDGWKLTLWK